MREFLISFLLCLQIQSTFSQSVSTIVGARASGLGNAAATLTDEWSLLNNSAGLAKTKDINTAFAFEAKPALQGSPRMAAAFSMPIKIGAIGAGVFKFGDKLYSEQIITTGFSNQFGIASIGLKLNYIQYRAEGFGTRSALTISAGGIAEITPQLSIGAYIQNINQPKIAQNERVPTRLAAGISFKPSQQVLILAEVEKDLAYDPIVKAGFEYVIHQKVFARTGFNINPEAAFFGIGFKGWRLKFDYSIQYKNALNFAHQASACYSIAKTKTNRDSKRK